jgi:hypothetical protein
VEGVRGVQHREAANLLAEGDHLTLEIRGVARVQVAVLPVAMPVAERRVAVRTLIKIRHQGIFECGRRDQVGVIDVLGAVDLDSVEALNIRQRVGVRDDPRLVRYDRIVWSRRDGRDAVCGDHEAVWPDSHDVVADARIHACAGHINSAEGDVRGRVGGDIGRGLEPRRDVEGEQSRDAKKQRESWYA